MKDYKRDLMIAGVFAMLTALAVWGAATTQNPQEIHTGVIQDKFTDVSGGLFVTSTNYWFTIDDGIVKTTRAEYATHQIGDEYTWDHYHNSGVLVIFLVAAVALGMASYIAFAVAREEKRMDW